MIFLDTNILVRLAVRDDPVQSEHVLEVFRKARRTGETIHVSSDVILETVWVLQKNGLGLSREDVADFISSFASIENTSIGHEDSVLRAVNRYRQDGDFADLLFLELSQECGARMMLSFDRKLRRGAPALVLTPEEYCQAT